MTRSFIVWARRLPRRKGLSTFRFFCVEMPGVNDFRSRQVGGWKNSLQLERFRRQHSS